MRNIIKSDFYKLKKSKAFWICIVLCVIFGVFAVVAFQANIQRDLSSHNPADHDYLQAVELTKVTSGVWGLQQFLPLNFNTLFVGVFIAIFVTSEFVYGTIKNTLSRGADRAKVFFSKLLVCGTAAVIMQILFIAALLAAGAAVWGFDTQGISTAGSMVRVLLSQILVIISFTVLFTSIATAIRSNGGSIATNILCATMISTFFNALNMLFNYKIAVNDYWIGGVVDKLANFTPAPGDILHGILVVLAWGVVSLLVGTALFKKQDVK